MSKIEEMRKALKDILEILEKRAPKGVDPKKHEQCVMDVKKQGHSVGSAHAICTSSMKKDETNNKIQAKLKAEMDRRNFGEADATRHVIDRDRGETSTPKPKQETFLQTEQEKDKEGTLWQQHHEKKPAHLHDHISMVAPIMVKGDNEQKYHIHVDGYRITTEPMSLAMIHKTQGKNLEKDPSVKIVPHNPGISPVVKADHETYKTDNNGQWKIEKSNYGPRGMDLYNQNDNAQRKAKNTGESLKDIGKNVNVKSYTTTGASVGQAASNAEAKRQAAANKIAPVKTLANMSEEEKASIGKPKAFKKSAEEFIKKCPSCKTKLTTSNAKFIGEQEMPEGYPGKMHLYNCPKCDSTVAHMKED